MSNTKTENIYFNAFNLVPNLGPKRFQLLLNYFPNLETAWKASPFEFKKAGLTENLTTQVLASIKTISPEKEYEKIIKNKISILTIKNKDYPPLLKEIYSPPPVLYTKGNFIENDRFSIGIVGSRKASFYGKRATQEITRGLIQNNITIVSGFAMGIDSEAHKATLKNNGRTIAVLGSGLDEKNIYPAGNRTLFTELLDNNNLIISEFPIGTKATKYTFPRRNRIISGLSKGVLLVEAAEKSGSLITAKYALEQNRDLFAIPGEIFKENSKGTNALIQKGAKLVLKAQDILEDLNLENIKKYSNNSQNLINNLSKEEKKILKVINDDPIYKDQILQKTSLPDSQILSTLSLMEMKGIIKDIGNGQYIKI